MHPARARKDTRSRASIAELHFAAYCLMLTGQQRARHVDDNRFIDIETKLAHQDDMLGKLNAALTHQQAQLSRLEALCESLVERLRSLADDGPAADSADQRPPHY